MIYGAVAVALALGAWIGIRLADWYDRRVLEETERCPLCKVHSDDLKEDFWDPPDDRPPAMPW